MSIFHNGPWHQWFAWYPVDTHTHGWRWLTVVERHRWDVTGGTPTCQAHRPDGITAHSCTTDGSGGDE